MSVRLSSSCTNESIKSNCLSCSDAKFTVGFGAFLGYVTTGDFPNFIRFVRCALVIVCTVIGVNVLLIPDWTTFVIVIELLPVPLSPVVFGTGFLITSGANSDDTPLSEICSVCGFRSFGFIMNILVLDSGVDVEVVCMLVAVTLAINFAEVVAIEIDDVATVAVVAVVAVGVAAAVDGIVLFAF